MPGKVRKVSVKKIERAPRGWKPRSNQKYLNFYPRKDGGFVVDGIVGSQYTQGEDSRIKARTRQTKTGRGAKPPGARRKAGYPHTGDLKGSEKRKGRKKNI